MYSEGTVTEIFEEEQQNICNEFDEQVSQSEFLTQSAKEKQPVQLSSYNCAGSQYFSKTTVGKTQNLLSERTKVPRGSIKTLSKKALRKKDTLFVKNAFIGEQDFEKKFDIVSNELEKSFEKYIVKHVRNSTRTFDLGDPFTAPKKLKQFKLSRYVGQRIGVKILKIKHKEEEKHKILLKNTSQQVKYCNNLACLNEMEGLKSECYKNERLIEKLKKRIVDLENEREQTLKKLPDSSLVQEFQLDKASVCQKRTCNFRYYVVKTSDQHNCKFQALYKNSGEYRCDCCGFMLIKRGCEFYLSRPIASYTPSNV